MALASTSRVQLRSIKETVFGETPTVGNPRDVRITGESLNYTINKEVSEEINSNRASTSMIPVSAEAGGTVNAELSYAEHDEWIAGVLQDAWVDTSISGNAAVAVGTITFGAPDPDLEDLIPGSWIYFSATGNANDKKAFKLHPTTLPTDTVLTLDPVTPGVVAASAAVTISTARLVNGVTQPSFTLERESGDTQEFFAFRGMTPSSMSLNVASGSRTTIDFDFMGKDAVRGANATTLPGTPTPSYAYDIMSGVSGTTCQLLVDGAPLAGTFINSIAMTYDNALRGQQALCALGFVGIGSGTINVTADVEVYFNQGAAFYDEFLDNDNIALTFTTFDTDGNGYIWTLPKANISTYDVSAGGRDQDLMASISLTGLLDNANPNPLLRKVMIIDRVGVTIP